MKVSTMTGMAAALLTVMSVSSTDVRASEPCMHSTNEILAPQLISLISRVQRNVAREVRGYRTSTGAFFEYVSGDRFPFANAVKAPDGTLWSERLRLSSQDVRYRNGGTVKDGIVTQSESIADAVGTCARLDCQLPTKNDYEKLKIYFDLDANGLLTEQGKKDYQKVFPDMEEKLFWSSSIYHPDGGNQGRAYIFNGSNGAIERRYRDIKLSVRCLRQN
ncbi:MAG: hypothetical protein HY074_04470 [Deltaproteobacteria bacterium]|nr:hypothetical protein [Deltaproteobacteria bacterium]